MRRILSGASVNQHWRHINAQGETQAGHGGLIAGQRNLPTLAARSGRRQFARDRMFPFRVYSLPDWMYDAAPADAWRTFRVRAGSYLSTDVAGTDAQNDDPYSESMPAAAAFDFTAPAATANYYVWIDIATVTIAHGLALPASGIVLIAKIDTATAADRNEAIVRQYVAGDIAVSGGAGGGVIRQLKLVGGSGDYVVGADWDGTTLGGDNFIVAKYPHTRMSNGSEVLDGITYTYGYTDANNRLSTGSDGTTQRENLVTPYAIDQVIIAAKCATPLGVGSAEYVEISGPQRMWVRSYNQI